MTAHRNSNIGHKQVEELVTVDRLKKEWLFGVTPIVDGQGNEVPPETFQAWINSAVSWLEHYLDMAITPRSFTAEEPESKDYHSNDYWEWGYFQLNNYPVISIEKLQIAYLRSSDQDGNIVPEATQDIPREWLRVEKETGIVRMVPNNKFPSNLQVGAGAAFFPELFRRQGMVPDVWLFEYTYGFKHGCIPVLINTAIGHLASIFALSIAGNLVLGAGIAASSLSMDDLSQSIQTTQSAENSAYSATLKEYAERLFGKNEKDPGLMGLLYTYYKGANINII